MTEKKRKIRLDAYLTEQGFFETRSRAQAAIMSGQVLADEQKIDKPGTAVKEGTKIRILGEQLRYVSRGGLKLEKALQVFPVSVAGKVVADIGASTGGFTDCALQNGAVRVYAIDVGYGQLAWKLRNDPRVVNMERTNARYLTADMLEETPDITVMDVSFISIRTILPTAGELMGKEGVFYTLIKPQFEAGRGKVGKKGVVRDPATHEDVLNGIVSFAEKNGWQVVNLDFSPIKGPEGNIEFLAEIRRHEIDLPMVTEDKVHRVVTEAHQKMKGSV